MRPKCFWFTDSIKNMAVENNYWFLSEIGSNMLCFYRQHFYRTFQCMEKSTERIFFIKIIMKMNLDPRNKKEITSFLVLDHPNLIKIKEIYETDENIYVVTETHTMNILDNFIEMKTFSERDVSMAIKSILRALAYLHGRNIFHRIINPENIVVVIENGQFVTKLDNCFMGSVAVDEVQSSFATSNLAFTAPEMLRSIKTEKSADMWAVGVVAYFLLSGHLPFFSHNPKESLSKLFAGKLDLDKIPKLTYTTRDFLEHLVNLDVKRRMKAEEALVHPWITNDLNSTAPMVGLAEKLDNYRKFRMIRARLDVVNSSNYDYLVTKRVNEGAAPITCHPPPAQSKSSRPVIVTAESNYYFLYGPTANLQKMTMDIDSTNACRILRCMYRSPHVTLYEEAIRCQAHYRSVFTYNEYIPSLWRIRHIPIVEDYSMWRENILSLKNEFLILQKMEEEKLMAARLDSEEEEEAEERDEHADKISLENLDKTSTDEADSSSSTKSGEESSQTAAEPADAKLLPGSLSVHSSVKVRQTESEMRFKGLLELESLFNLLPEHEEVLESLAQTKRVSEYAPDIQLITELMVAQPKKRFQKRDSNMDFTLMINLPELFTPFYTDPQPSVDAELAGLKSTVSWLHQLYRFRPPFDPSQLGVDQFTVEQQGPPGTYIPFKEPEDEEHAGDQRYLFCRAGVTTKEDMPPWLLDVDNQTPLLVPISKFNSIVHKGVPVPDNCVRTPPDPLPVDHFSIYDLVDDPMLSRFNSFSHPYVRNSTPPEIHSAQRLLPYPVKPRNFRDRHCPVDEPLFKRCPYKKMMEQRMLKIGKLPVSLYDEADLSALAEGSYAQAPNAPVANQTPPNKAGFEIDGGKPCNSVWGLTDSNNEVLKTAKLESEDDDHCVHLACRPCRLKIFDAEGMVCAHSRDGNCRLCCKNLYQVWDRMERENKLADTEQHHQFGNFPKSVPTASRLPPDAHGEGGNKVVGKRQDSIGALVVNITENPPRMADELSQQDKPMKKSGVLETELERTLLKLQALRDQRDNQPTSCKDISWSPFEFLEGSTADRGYWRSSIYL